MVPGTLPLQILLHYVWVLDGDGVHRTMPSGPAVSTPGGGEGAPVAPVGGRGPSTVSRRYTGTATSTLHGGSVTGRQIRRSFFGRILTLDAAIYRTA